MNITQEQLKRIIKEELDDMLAKASDAEAEINYDVPPEAKEQIFAKMVAKGFASEDDFEGAEFWEVNPGDYGYDTDMSVEIAGKRYYGEV